MNLLARFTVRPTDKNDGPGDLVIGVMLKKQNNLLRPGRIYQISDIMDTLMIKDVGPSAIGYDRNYSCIEVNWMHSIEQILCSGHWLLTANEYSKIK